MGKRIIVQGRMVSSWKSAVADLTELEARSFVKPLRQRSRQEQLAAVRAVIKLKKLIERMV